MLVSSIVNSTFPGVLLSPTDTLTAVTTPLIGALSSQSASCSFNPSSVVEAELSVDWYFSISTTFCADSTALDNGVRADCSDATVALIDSISAARAAYSSEAGSSAANVAFLLSRIALSAASWLLAAL